MMETWKQNLNKFEINYCCNLFIYYCDKPNKMKNWLENFE